MMETTHSADGTSIAYDQVGLGGPVVLVSGRRRSSTSGHGRADG
jgi:hypothetical protein